MTEADTCRKYVVPKLLAAGWDNGPHSIARDIGRGHMQTFQDVETATPAILTTSQLLSTGLDAPTCKNVVIARLVNLTRSSPVATRDAISYGIFKKNFSLQK